MVASGQLSTSALHGSHASLARLRVSGLNLTAATGDGRAPGARGTFEGARRVVGQVCPDAFAASPGCVFLDTWFMSTLWVLQCLVGSGIMSAAVVCLLAASC